MEVQLCVIDSNSGNQLGSLWDWLTREDNLRGSVSHQSPTIGDTQLGSATDHLTVAVGSGGAALALSRVLIAWLETRKGSVKVKVATRDRTTIVETSNLRAARSLLDQTLYVTDDT